jgi:hypothetical protein
MHVTCPSHCYSLIYELTVCLSVSFQSPTDLLHYCITLTVLPIPHCQTFHSFFAIIIDDRSVIVLTVAFPRHSPIICRSLKTFSARGWLSALVLHQPRAVRLRLPVLCRHIIDSPGTSDIDTHSTDNSAAFAYLDVTFSYADLQQVNPVTWRLNVNAA